MCAGRRGPIRIGPMVTRAGDRLDQVVGGAGGVQARHDQEVGGACRASRATAARGSLGDRAVSTCISPSTSSAGARCAQDRQRLAHLARGGRVAAAEIAVADQRHLGLEAEAAHERRRPRIAVSAISAADRVVADAGVGDEQRAAVQHQRVDAPRPRCISGRSPITSAMWRRWVASLPTGPAACASASPRASMTAAITVRRVRSDLARVGRRDALARHALEVEGDSSRCSAGRCSGCQLVVAARPAGRARGARPAPRSPRAGRSGSGAPAAPRPRPAPRAARAPPRRRCRPAAAGWRRRPRRSAASSGRTDHALRQPLAVGREVGDRARRHAGVHGGLGDGRRQFDDQARVERLGDQIVGAEAQLVDADRPRSRSRAAARGEPASASTQAIFISSLIVVAPHSSAPRKMNGKHRTLLTWFG